MSKWYTHLVELESIHFELDKMSLSEQEKLHLSQLIDSSLHNTILDAILSELSKEDKIIFLRYVNENDHKKIWQFLNQKITNIEGKIKIVAEDLKKELHKDIKKAKEK